MRIKKSMLLMALIGSTVCRFAIAEEDASADTSAFNDFLKSFDITEAELQSRVGSTNMFGGSSPVSFSGEGRVKLQYHKLETDQEWLIPDRSYIQSGWEGNESLIRLAMVARAGRNTVLYSKIGFQHTLPGNRYINSLLDDGSTEAQTRHDKSLVTANIHEDMGAGMAVRTVPASFWLRMGNVNWIEASPFTVWKAQPRTFAWEFLPFEIEQPIARYYEYNVAKGEKAGRAAWHKKPFNGINFESISLPAHLYFNLVWGTVERYDNYEREYIDFAGDRAYSNPFPLKATGIGDSYRHMFHTRLARSKLAGDLTLGINYNRLDYNDDFFLVRDDKVLRFVNLFDIASSDNTDQLNTAAWDGTGFYKEPQVWSLDLRGKIGGDLMEIHSDVAVGRVDTTFLTWRTADTLFMQRPDGTTTDTIIPNNDSKYEKRKSSSDIVPAFFTKLRVNTVLPFQIDFAAIGPGFYSPSSFVAPTDAFYAFGSNMVGSGKFLARHEASPYVQNMAGMQLSAMPKLSGYGHLRVAYGQHFQLKEGRDILYMPYRLNGLDLSTLTQSSYARWGSGPTSLSIVGGDTDMKYRNRLGDQSFVSETDLRPFGMEGGGLYIDYLSANECFVPYPDSASAAKNYAMYDDRNQKYKVGYTRVLDGDTSETGFVPKSKKFTNNFEIDAAYDISDLIGYRYNLFIGGYAAINNVTGAFSPLAISTDGDDVKLWSLYLRFEPAVQLTKKFYLLGILGFENWRSQKAWMYLDDRDLVKDNLSAADTLAYDNGTRIFNVPIDYRDAALGLGFDWEILNRVGLHFRAKYMRHKDVGFKLNNWATPITSLEIKTWF
ncbi:MAG: hypothetical protein JW863_03605 [Chitinispirillaceae bacterium]|nr:hypothetical protein [Chitinispirillaceae bacterium]